MGIVPSVASLIEYPVLLRVEVATPNTWPDINWEGPAYFTPEVISVLSLLKTSISTSGKLQEWQTASYSALISMVCFVPG